MKSGSRHCSVFLLVLLTAGSLLAQAAPAAQEQARELVKQGRKLNDEGKQDQAFTLYQQALQKSPELFEAHLAAGQALDLQGKYDDARRELARAIQLAPAELKIRALKAMAISYAFERNPAEAAKYEQQAFDSQMGSQNFFAAGETANELARIYLESGDLDNAQKWYHTGYETGLRQPDIKPAIKDLWEFRWEHAQARIAARRGQQQQAQKHVAAAKAVLDKGTNPEQARFFPYLEGYVAFYSGDYKTAIAELQKADQRDPFILVLLAQAYEKSGDKAQATEYYRKVLGSNAHNPVNAFARPLAKQKLS
jgi:tetratricopeptide (TPR) repeat protein